MKTIAQLLVTSALLACTKPAPAEPAAEADVQAADAPLADGAVVSDAQSDAAADASADAGTDAVADAGVVLPPGPPLPTQRGWQLGRTVVHIHSPYSHDACDGEVSKLGTINAQCFAQLRAGLCASGLDVAFLTDHPGTMNSRTFEQLLLFDAKAGDELQGPVGKPYGNAITCPAASGVPEREVVVAVGFESTHLMPVGLHAHVTQSAMEGGSLSDAVTLSDARARVDMAHAAGALVVNAHSEEEEIGFQRLIDAGVDAMEIYNIHANFNAILGKSGAAGGKATLNLGRVFELENFLGPPEDSPLPGLLLLVMLDVQPEAAFAKWQRVLGYKHVTGLLGNDVHQNVTLEAYCGPGGQFEGACDGFKDQYPHLVKLLTEGGTPMLADGARIDSYPRMLQSISDRPLVPAATLLGDRLEAFKGALVAGRNWIVFDLLGEPTDFDFLGEKDGKFYEMGETVPLGTRLWLRTPSSCAPPPWMPWTLAETQNPSDLTETRTLVWYIAPQAEKAENIMEVKGFAQALQFKPTKPGRYHLETRIVPRHLRKWLKALGDHAAIEQRWLVSNPIEIK